MECELIFQTDTKFPSQRQIVLLTNHSTEPLFQTESWYLIFTFVVHFQRRLYRIKKIIHAVTPNSRITDRAQCKGIGKDILIFRYWGFIVDSKDEVMEEQKSENCFS